MWRFYVHPRYTRRWLVGVAGLDLTGLCCVRQRKLVHVKYSSSGSLIIITDHGGSEVQPRRYPEAEKALLFLEYFRAKDGKRGPPFSPLAILAWAFFISPTRFSIGQYDLQYVRFQTYA